MAFPSSVPTFGLVRPISPCTNSLTYVPADVCSIQTTEEKLEVQRARLTAISSPIETLRQGAYL
eukprot:SAG11_NODE_720_length_7550_cov_12.284257_6_plen_64_part_00